MMSVRQASLRNLRAPWKPGQSGNLAGRPSGTGFWEILMRDVSLRGSQGGDTQMMEHAREREIVTLIPCSVCRHPLRAVIDGLLVLGVPLRALAVAYKVSRSSLHRHKSNHSPTFPTSERAGQTVQAESVLPGVLNAFHELASCLSGSRFVELAEASLDALWEAFEALLTDDPRDSLLISSW